MRILEGLSTGAMVSCYLLKQRFLNDCLLYTYFVHWIFSFWFHMTYSPQIYIMDTMLIHLLIIERLLKCYSISAILFQILFLIRNEKYGYIYNVLIAFLGCFLCGPIKNNIAIVSTYITSIIIAGFFYILNYILYLKGCPQSSSVAIILYHLFLGVNVYYELPLESHDTEIYWIIIVLRFLSWCKCFYYFGKVYSKLV